MSINLWIEVPKINRFPWESEYESKCLPCQILKVDYLTKTIKIQYIQPITKKKITKIYQNDMFHDINQQIEQQIKFLMKTRRKFFHQNSNL